MDIRCGGSKMVSAVAKFFLILSIIILEIASSYEKVGVHKWGLDFYISLEFISAFISNLVDKNAEKIPIQKTART